jgi:O-antigen ligase
MTTFAPESTNLDKRPQSRPRQAALVLLALTVAATEFSIAIGQTFLALALVAWAVVLVTERRRPTAPSWTIPLICYAGWTLVSAVFSPDFATSIRETKQIVLLLLVPLTYEIVNEDSAVLLTTIMLAAGAASAVVGIGQYSILHYDNLGLRPRSTLGLYMTFSGLMMLMLNLALARVLFMTKSRMWPALLVPALVVALALSLSRNDWVGACCAVAFLLMLRDFRLTAILPAAAAVFFAVASPVVLQRFYSIFNPQDASARDRLAMFRAGVRIIKDHPIVGVGPNMIARIYPQYRDAAAVLQAPPHLHNVPLQIAAERGLPALACWVWFVVAAVMGSVYLFRRAPGQGPVRFLSAAALASIVGMLGAGLFEHNFGDSEFLMIFLVLVTLPFAVSKESQATW